MTLGKVFWGIVRLVCYAALILVLAGAASLFGPFLLDLCSQQSGGTVACVDPFYRSVFEFGYTVVLMTVFTGLPGLLALGGLFFFIRDVFWRRNRME